MKNKEKIEELKKLVKDYETIIDIHTTNDALKNSKTYIEYIDSILDEINEIKKTIQKLEKE